MSLTLRLHKLAFLLGKATTKTVRDYCHIEAPEDDETFICRDGSYLSFLRVGGNLTIVGGEEFSDIMNSLNVSLDQFLKNSGYGFQLVFTRNPDNAKKVVSSLISGQRLTANRLGLSLDDVFNERESILSKVASEESIFICLFSFPGMLDKTSAEIEKQKKASILSKVSGTFNGQHTLNIIYSNKIKHSSFVRSVHSSLSSNKIKTQICEVHEALREVRSIIDPHLTDENWIPRLVGDPFPVRTSQNIHPSRMEDASNTILSYPLISDQLFPSSVTENPGLGYVKIGDIYHSSVFMEIPPERFMYFNQLFSSISNLDDRMPWRLSFFSEGAPLFNEDLSVKRTLAAYLGMTSSKNKLINKAFNSLSTSIENGGSFVSMKIVGSTSASSLDVLERRKSYLIRALNGWGGSECVEEKGSPFAGFISSLPGVSRHSIGNAMPTRLSDFLKILPFSRATSPWEKGSVLCKTLSGKIFPFQPGSSLQATWIDLFFAKPGSGKSVLMNLINLGLITSAGAEDLPYVSLIDFGPSSEGLISMIKDSLPKDKKHLAVFETIRMDKRYAINPFDTQLGGRKPTNVHYALLKRFLVVLCTPVGKNAPYEGMAELVGQIITEAYEERSDKNNPSLYSPRLDDEVDKFLATHDFPLDSRTSWWEVVDFIFENGSSHLASRAQRFAVPSLPDLPSIANGNPAIKQEYGNVETSTKESLVALFCRQISSSIKEFPILSLPTVFDLGEARIVSLDLDFVTFRGGEGAQRQSTLMFMLATHILTSKFRADPNEVKYSFPELYWEYQTERYKNLKSTKKRFVIDEFDRTKSSASTSGGMRDQVLEIMREGRKFNIQVALASQKDDDFDQGMLDFATNLFMFYPGSGHVVKRLAKSFALSATEAFNLENNTHGPSRNGVTFLFRTETKANGFGSHVVNSLIGPVELWAFSSSSEDVSLRTLVYSILGSQDGRLALARFFPGGSAMAEIERRKEHLGDSRSDSAENGVMVTLAEEVVASFRRSGR